MKNQKINEPEGSFYIDSRKITRKELKRIDELVRKNRKSCLATRQAGSAA